MQRLILRAARALVGPRLEPQVPAAIAVEGSAIAEIGADIPGEGLDLGDLTLLPGFIDAHVHIGFADPAAVVHGGVTTVRDLAWPLPALRQLVDRSHAPGYVGPTILAAGQMLTVAGGYPTRAAWAPEGTGRVVAGAGDAATAVTEQVDIGACVIKVALNAAVGPTFDTDTLREVCDAAHDRGLRVTAHIDGLQELVKALDAGVDEMAHVLLSAEPIPDEITARMVERDMTVVPTLSITSGRLKRHALLNLSAFADAGGRVVYGTDLGNAGPKPGIDKKEVDRMMRSSMGSPDIVAAGTTRAASWLGLDAKGVIAPGKDADLIAVAGDPMDAAISLTDVRFVMRMGRIVREPAR